MDQEEIFRRLAVGLAIGLLIGLERGWQTRGEANNQRAAGLRTFALTGLLGGISGAISTVTSPVVLAVALLAYTGATMAFSALEAIAEKSFSVTGVSPACSAPTRCLASRRPPQRGGDRGPCARRARSQLTSQGRDTARVRDPA